MPVDPGRRVLENPFFVLGVPHDAPRADIERAAQRLLAEIALGREASLTYTTPLGPAPRTADLVRAAVGELRDPARRLLHELRARSLPREAQQDRGSQPEGFPWALAARAFGLRRP